MESKMDLVFRRDPYARDCTATVTAAMTDDSGGAGVRLDRTVFYPTGGGQPGDTGTLTLADGTRLVVTDTVKGAAGAEDVVHLLGPGTPLPAVGETVTAAVDWDRRHRLMRMHTCLHLLSAVLPFPVTGGSVGEVRGRLDFDIPEATLDKDELTAALNRLVDEDHPVVAEWITDAELAAQPELVKTMAVKPPAGSGRVRLIRIAGLDLQPCGGTHVARTGEIGPVAVVKTEKKGRQNRRVTIAFADPGAAAAGTGAMEAGI